MAFSNRQLDDSLIKCGLCLNRRNRAGLRVEIAVTINRAIAMQFVSVGMAINSWAIVSPAIAQPANTEEAPRANAAAAEPVQTANDQSDGGVIIVTARRREENLQDVPLAISAISGQKLEEAGVKDLRDLAQLTPNLSVNDGGAQFYSAPTIRGLSQLNTNNGLVENNVSVFLNGVYLPNASAINLSLLNLERVEVVKGPVSALYGRNAFAGAINYVTRSPSRELTAELSGILGTGERRALTGLVSGPLATGLRATLGGTFDTYGGTWQDPVNGNDAGGYKKRNVVAAIQADIAPGAKLDVAGYYGNDEFDPPVEYHLDNNCGLSGGVFRQFCGKIPQVSQVEIASPYASGAAGNKRDVKHIDAKLTVGLGADYDLSTTLGWNELHARQLLEISGRRNGLPYNLSPGPGTVQLPFFYGDDLATKDFSSEVRLASSRDSRFTWSIGGFYFRSRGHQITNLTVPSELLPAGQAVANALVTRFLRAGGRPDPNRPRGDAKVGTEQYSGFAEAQYAFGNGIKVSQEIRYTDETKSIRVLNVASPPFTIPPPLSSTFRYWNTRSSLSYEPSNDTSLYASIANGTKTGGFNARAALAQDRTYKPEKGWTYEAGIKGILANGTVRYDAAVYHITWNSMQILGPNSDPNNPGQIVGNYGAAKNTGFEVASSIRLLPEVHLDLGFAYNDAKFTKALDGQYAAICPLVPSCASRIITVNGQRAIDLGGLALPRQSRYQANAKLDVAVPLSTDWSGFGLLTYAYQSKQYFQPANFSFWGGTHTVGLRTGVKNDFVTITGWVENLTQNKEAYMAYYNVLPNTFPTLAFETLPIYPEKRTFGVTISSKF
jgi:iron complex outermembrane receptor protein